MNKSFLNNEFNNNNPIELSFYSGKEFIIKATGLHVEILLLKGTCKFYHGETTVTVTAPSYIDLLPFEKISDHDASDDLSAFVIYSTMVEYNRMMFRSSRIPFRYLIKLRRDPEMRLTREDAMLLKKRAEIIADVIQNKTAFNYMDRIGAAYLIFETEVATIFLSQRASEVGEDKYIEVYASLFEAFYSSVTKHIRKIHDVKWYATRVGVTVQHLARVTKHLLKITPKQYIDYMLMSEIQNLLVSSMLSIKEIAYECGFETPDALYRFVKRVMGCTPTDIRNHGLS